MQWRDVLTDPYLRDLSYKIQLNERGKIEISSASNRYGFTWIGIGFPPRQYLPHGHFQWLP